MRTNEEKRKNKKELNPQPFFKLGLNYLVSGIKKNLSDIKECDSDESEGRDVRGSSPWQASSDKKLTISATPTTKSSKNEQKRTSQVKITPRSSS